MFSRLSVTSAIRRSRASRVQRRSYAQKYNNQKVVAVLYKGGSAAQEQPKLLAAAENELGLRPFLEGRGHSLKTMTDKGAALDAELPDTDILVTTPFHPAYVTAERIATAKNLKLVVTAGVGSDHVDLDAACKANITVAEVTGCNVVSVAEHVVMQILALVRNYIPAYKQVVNGEWDVAQIAKNAYDLEGKVVGTVGAGRIGLRVLERLKPFDVKLLYSDYQKLPADVEASVGAEYRELKQMLSECDVVTVNCPLTTETDEFYDKNLLQHMKKGAWLVNTARGKIMNRDDLVEAVNSGHIAGYAGDVWYPQPAPADHPWRQMPNHALTPHYSGTTLDAQARYAAGSEDIIKNFLDDTPIKPEDLIVQGGEIVSPSYNRAKV